jgi:hypothetical protein
LESGAVKSKIRLILSPTAEKYARRDAPLKVRKLAARGTLPLEPLDLATLLFALCHDPEQEVRIEARETLAKLPEEILNPTLNGPAHPALLAHLAQLHRENAAFCQAIALNPATSDRTIAFLASLPLRSVVDIVSNNQERLQREGKIIEALGENPLTGRAVIERILNFLGIATAGDKENATVREPTEEEATRAVLAVLGDQSLATAKLLTSEEENQEEVSTDNIFSAIQKMSVMQKIKLARIGGKEARNLLIKDRNKVVALSALQSPKIGETEIVSIAQSRSVSDEILRLIASNKEWTRSYPVKLALTTNPKTPLPQAVKFLNYLQDRDLRALTKSKDVSSAISSHARRLLDRKGLA